MTEFLSLGQVAAAMGGSSGLRVRTRPYSFVMRSRLPEVHRAVTHLYRAHLQVPSSDFVDFDVEVARPANWRRWWKPQVVFLLDGRDPFNPLPGDQGFPLLEWGMNWCIYSLCHQHLTLHAAVVERGGRALILPAPSGSGKSTLCAALLFSGWRLLSDELTLLCPQQRNVIPIPRPVSIKNQSIEVLQRFAPAIEFGSKVLETSKGVVAHFRPPAEAVAALDRRAEPGWVVLPKFVVGSPTRMRPLERARALMYLIENAFNHNMFGVEGFELLASVVDRSVCFALEYSDLAEAVALFARLADEGTIDPRFIVQDGGS